MVLQHDATNVDFVNTTEAYSKDMYIGNNIIVIPFINLGLMPSNPINGKQSVIDYSYYMIKGVKSIFFNGKKDRMSIDFGFSDASELMTEHIILGGYEPDNGAEVTIRCNERVLYLPDTSAINEPIHLFVPRDTPMFKSNMQKDKVEAFFSADSLPDEIKRPLEKDFYTLTWH